MSESNRDRPVKPNTGQPLPEDALASIEHAVGSETGRDASPAGGAPAASPQGVAPAAGQGSIPESGSASAPAPASGSGPAPESGSASASAPASGSGPAPEPGSAAAPSQQEMAVRSALETVMDPEIGLSVIDLGLIREIHLLPDKTSIRMLLTTPFCPYAPQLMAEIKEATMNVVPVACEVEILPDPWSPEMMPDPGLLGYSF